MYGNFHYSKVVDPLIVGGCTYSVVGGSSKLSCKTSVGGNMIHYGTNNIFWDAHIGGTTYVLRHTSHNRTRASFGAQLFKREEFLACITHGGG